MSPDSTEKTRQMVTGGPVIVDSRMKLLTLRKLKEKRDNAAVSSMMIPSPVTTKNSHETRHVIHDEKTRQITRDDQKIRQIARVVEEEDLQEEGMKKNM